MTGWHLTWQDPVALLVCLIGLVLSLYLRARLPKESGCGGCPKEPRPPPLVPAKRLVRR
jgi:hypothetical protein